MCCAWIRILCVKWRKLMRRPDDSLSSLKGEKGGIKGALFNAAETLKLDVLQPWWNIIHTRIIAFSPFFFSDGQACQERNVISDHSIPPHIYIHVLQAQSTFHGNPFVAQSSAQATNPLVLSAFIGFRVFVSLEPLHVSCRGWDQPIGSQIRN